MSLAQLFINSSSNGSFGTFVANATTPVTVANTSVTADSIILFQRVGAAASSGCFITNVTSGVSFQVNSVAGDTSTYRYVILNPLPQ